MPTIKTYLLLIVLILTNNVHALSEFSTSGLSVGSLNDFSMRTLLSNNFYDRDIYPSIGISFKIEQRSYSMVEHGEFWTISLIENTTGQAVFTPRKYVALTSRYDFDQVCIYPLGVNDFIQFDDPRRYCFWSTMPIGYRQWAAPAVNWSLPCEDTGNYTASVVHSQGVYKSEFILSDFVPGEPLINGVNNISPFIPSSPLLIGSKPETPAGEMNITVDVKDKHGCDKPLADIDTTLTVTIVPQSGSHEHYTNPDKAGTGTFTSAIPAATVTTNQSIRVKTDANGQIKAVYKAGIYGVDEKLTVIAQVPDSEQIKESSQIFSIKVPGLIPLLADGTTYNLRGSYGPGCDITHNGSSTNRYSHYVTPFTKAKIGLMNEYYKLYTGNSLCLNDASLANGGYFDNGVGGECHTSHRQGIDIDVNTRANAPCTENLETEKVSYKGKMWLKSHMLDDIAYRLNAKKVIEPTLHYRFSN